MANKEINELTAGTTLDGTEVFHGVQSDNSRLFTSLQLLTPALSAANKAAARAAIGAALKGHQNGLAIAVGSDAVNDINVAAGEAASEQSDPLLMVYAGASGIQIDVAYGTGSGGRFDTSISDGTWFIFLISNGTTTGIGFSKSADPTGAANWPSGYTHYRTIGYVVRASSANSPPIMLGSRSIEVAGVAPIFGVRAWVEFDGTTGTIRRAGNVSSVSRTVAGDYTITFATAMPHSNYVVSGTAQAAAASNAQAVVTYVSSSATGAVTLKSTTQVRIYTANASAGTPADFGTVTILVVG